MKGRINKKVAQNRIKPNDDKVCDYERKTQLRNIFRMYDINQKVNNQKHYTLLKFYFFKIIYKKLIHIFQNYKFFNKMKKFKFIQNFNFTFRIKI